MIKLLVILAMFFPPCEYEDSNNCYWDAASRGNGQGTSFVVIDDVVIRLQEL